MNKRYIKVIIIIIFLSLLFLFTIGFNLIKNNKTNDYIITDNFIFKNIKNKWSIESSGESLKEYNWKYLNVYTNHEYLGKYYLYYNDKWYLFDKDKKALNYDGNLISFNNSKYKDVFFEIKDSLDSTFINKILTDNDINTNQTFTANYYIDIDIDNDEKLERLYVVSNRFPTDSINTNIYFNFVYLVKNNKINIIYKDIEKTTDSYSGCKPYISNIIYNNEEKKFSIILNCAEYSTGKVTSKLYEYKNNRFKELISN